MRPSVLLANLRALTRAQVVATLLMPMATLVFCVCLTLAGGVPWPYFLVFSWAFLLAPLTPDSEVPAVALVGMGVCWVIGAWTPEGLVALGAALSIAVFHLAAAFLSTAPPGVVLRAGLVRTWLGRSAVVLAATVLAWLVAQAFHTGHELPPMARTLALVVVAGLAVASTGGGGGHVGAVGGF